MKLTLPERVSLLAVLPVEGNIVTLRIVRELQNQLGFSEEEIRRYGIKNNTRSDGTTFISWNPDMAKEEKDIEIGEAAKGVIVNQLKKLDAQGKLHISMMPLYEKFVEGKE